MSKKNNAPRLGNAVGGVSSLLASLVCILIGLTVGFVVLLTLGSITLEQEGNADDPQILHAQFAHGSVLRVNAHHLIRRKHGQQ